jgi:hypothetical protein
MVSYYRINVSQNGIYLFATEQGQITFFDDAMKVIKLFKVKFPEDEGYKVACTHWRGIGKEIEC